MAPKIIVVKLNLYLFQPQHATIFHNQPQFWLPYTAGVLWAYAKQFSVINDHWDLKKIFYRRDTFDQVLDNIVEPDLCAFSTYVWNAEYNLQVSRQIKQYWPRCKIIFGGPQINASWLQFDHIDSLILNEGEECFREILETLISNNCLNKFYKKPRMESIDSVPSPYGQPFFDDIVRSNPETLWSASLETNRGCPYSCTFCDWGSLTQSKIKKFPLCRVASDIEWLSKNPIRTLFVSDANFGIFKDRDKTIAKMLQQCISLPDSKLEYLSITYAKNSNEDVFEIAKMLEPKHKGVTFSVQSMNPETLTAIKRQNMDTNDISTLLALSEQHHVQHYTELIIGLPFETIESWKKGICELLEIGQHQRITVHFNNLLENTELRDIQSKTYAIDFVMAKNVIPFTDGRDIVVDEFFPIVRSTQHMTLDELVEAYMYSWMIVHLHLQGYTLLIAKYCRKILQISYRDFYDRMFELLQADQQELGTEYIKIKKSLQQLLQTGEITDFDVLPGNVLHHSLDFFYQNLAQCVNLGESVANSFGPVDTGIMDLQRRWISNDIWPVPVQISCGFDIKTWSVKSTRYQISGPLSQIDIDKDTLFTAQVRNKMLYNQIKEITNEF